MIMPSKDTLYNGRKRIDFENPSYFEKAKDLRPSLYDEKVMYTPMFLTYSDEALEIEKFKRARENKIEFAYDYGSLNASYVKEKINFSDLDTFSSVRRPKQSSVIWKKKRSSNTFYVDLSFVSHLKLNKGVKRYSRKDLLSCNNSHLGETSSAFDCNNDMNVSCNSRLYASYDENDLFIFDDENVRHFQVSKMSFRKMPRDFIIVRSKSNSNKSLPRTVHRHMMGNRALLTNFVEKFLGTVRFGNNDFAVIVGYGDVVIGSMTINKSLLEVGVSLSNTQPVSNNMVPNVDEESKSYNVFNECLEDAYFDAIGYSQQEGINYDETFALAAQIEAIRLFLAYVAHKDFTVFQMDVKITFLNGILKEKVYVGQPPGFVSKQYPDYLYALNKALYGLKQAPRAWYNVLLQFLIDSGFQKVPTPMVEQAKLKLDLVEKPLDQTDYRSMIGSLMYVTSSRPNIMFSTCVSKIRVSLVKAWILDLDFGLDLTSVPSLVTDYSDIGSPEVNRPPSPDYVPGPEEPEQAPLSPDYVPGPKEPEQALPLPVYFPYVSELVYPEYMPPEDDVFLAEEQPLPEDDDEDPKEDPADYLADSTVVALPAVDHVPSEEVTKPLPQIPSPPLPIPSPPPNSPSHIEILESCLPLRKRLCFASPTITPPNSQQRSGIPLWSAIS
nr:retrovirus-related Pol polyprotein from transposon TNT 1-94 [Tanacetum cinerariifolium]